MSAKNEPELDWIQLRKDFGSIHAETTREKMDRKLRENPFVPIGLLLSRLIMEVHNEII